MSKLTWHFQHIRPDEVVDIADNSQAEWVKGIHLPEGENPFPGNKVIGRVWIGGDGVEGEYIRQGAKGADAYFARVLPFYQARPYVHCWEGPNEPQPMSEQWFRLVLADFEVRWIHLMHAHGLLAAGVSLSEGNLPTPEAALDLAPIADVADYFAFHEYGAPRMQDGMTWHCLRYRMIYQWLKNARIRRPPLLITECGIDGGVIGRAKKGWKSFGSEETYMTQLAWYDAELCKDDYVECATIFTAGPNSDWVDFELGPSLSRKIAQHIETHPHEQVLPPPPGDVIQQLMYMAEPSVIPMVPGHAIFDAIRRDGNIPCSREDRTVLEGVRWAWQWGYDQSRNSRWLYACREGDWGNIEKQERPN